MKTVGIIGGLGPETTAEFYLEIVSASQHQNNQARPPILMWSIPLPLKIEEDLITKAEGEERYLPFMIDAAQRLEKGGADFIVIPCNSVHIFIDQVRAAVKIPVLSIVEETIKFLNKKSITEVGLLATSTTINSGLYTTPFNSQNIKVVAPDEDQQSKVGSVIFNLVNNKYTAGDQQEIIQIINGFKDKGVKTVLLACTDLQLLDLSSPGLEIHDTMKILADVTVQQICQ